MRISHSGKNTHKECSEKYRLHYIEKLRGQKIFSALFFGSALDEAFSRLLLDKKPIKTPEELLQLDETAEGIFYKHMSNVRRDDGTIVEASKSPFADYYASDFTPELLSDQAVALLQEYAPDVAVGESVEEAKESVLGFMESCKAHTKAKKKLSQDDVPVFNYITWLTLVEKGYLMVEAYRNQIMPQIFEVYSIQEKISVKNEAGDEITGLIDFTASFVQEPGTMYVCDNKTSSKPYKLSDTAESAQLATYCEYKQTNKAAYVVIEKKVYAKAPVIHTQILKDVIPEAIFAQTFTEFEEVVYSINTGAFEKNFKSCFSFGRMCQFYAICKHNNYEGLIKKKED